MTLKKGVPRVEETMARCLKCGEYYPNLYDSCPNCKKQDQVKKDE